MPDVAAGRRFAELFAAEPDVTADAPGRVNLIGEHTDYQDGFVLPCAIPQRTRVELRRRDDRRVRVWSAVEPEPIVEYRRGEERRRGEWIDYVAGLTSALDARGVEVSGFDLRIESDVPVGAGLSSSAALEIAVLRALRTAFGLALDDVQIARVGQQAEVGFVGAPVGIMDQMAVSLATERDALFLDTRTLEYDRVPVPEAIELAVVDSGIAHHHASGSYRTRRAETEEAARLLGVKALRDVPESLLPRLAELPALLARRARHVVTENGRVLAAVAAMRAGRPHELGWLLNASHASLRDDFDVSVPDVDTLVRIAQADADGFGARMTGGGFGGSIVVLCRAGRARAAARRIVESYVQSTRRDARVLLPRPK